MAVDPEILALLLDLKGRLRRRFGDRFEALYLFGSRARGDAEPDSDVDVAVVLKQKMPRPFSVEREIIEDTYDLLLERGYYIQPWAIEESSLEQPDAHPCTTIVGAVLREGVRV